MSHTNYLQLIRYAAVLLGTALWATGAQSQVAAVAPHSNTVTVQHVDVRDGTNLSAESTTPLRRQVVDYSTAEAPGTVIVDTPSTYLYFVLGDGKAIRYGIGVGREGFTWSGVKAIERKTEWPDWFPPSEMIERQPYLPRFMAGGPGNPLGARAMYIGGTLYRIHGTNAPETIGKQVSSGCIRMMNEDVIDLYDRVQVGTRVVILPMSSHQIAQTQRPQTVSIPVTATSNGFGASYLY